MASRVLVIADMLIHHCALCAVVQDEEGSEDENEYQVDGFVVPEGEDDEGRKSGKRRHKKVRKRLRRVHDVSGPVSTSWLSLQQLQGHACTLSRTNW
jgi:hypothetical protein